MIKKTIHFQDYNGDDQVQDFYFHLNKAELTEMEVSEEGGLGKTIERIVAEENHKKIVEILKKVIIQSYGKKTVDGRFIKNQELIEDFVSSEAYSELFTELASDADAASAFINGIMPKV